VLQKDWEHWAEIRGVRARSGRIRVGMNAVGRMMAEEEVVGGAGGAGPGRVWRGFEEGGG